MTDFKIGNKVKLKDGFNPEEHREDNNPFVQEMDKYIGTTFFVEKIDEDYIISDVWHFYKDWIEIVPNQDSKEDDGQEESVCLDARQDEKANPISGLLSFNGELKADEVMNQSTIQKGDALRYDKGKTQLDLIPPFVIEQLGKVLTFGAEKYDKDNYRKGMKWSKVIGSLMRHINAFRAGEDFDKETGIYHIAHAMCNLTFLLEYYRIYPQGDDRVQKYLEMPTVGLDIDDVLADTVNYWCKYHQCDIPAWWHDSNFKKERFDALNNNKDFWLNIPPKIKPEDLNFEPVCYVTSRSIPQEWTREWLIKNGFPDVTLISVGYGKSKVDALRGMCDIFIDDRFDNFVELNRNGICCYLMDAPHNKRYDVGYKRITNIKEFLR
jgi:5'(3')-deoxyribonucleotidase